MTVNRPSSLDIGWLAAADVDDRKAAMAQADLEPAVGRLGKPVACTIRPAMGHQVRNAGKGLAVLAIGGTKGPTEYPAHSNFPGPFYSRATLTPDSLVLRSRAN